jgi:hypothetical protein
MLKIKIGANMDIYHFLSVGVYMLELTALVLDHDAVFPF